MGLEGALVSYIAIRDIMWSLPGELEALHTFLPFHLSPETLHQIQLEPVSDTSLLRIGFSSKFSAVKMKSFSPKCSDALILRKILGKAQGWGRAFSHGGTEFVTCTWSKGEARGGFGTGHQSNIQLHQQIASALKLLLKNEFEITKSTGTGGDGKWAAVIFFFFFP